MPAPALSDVAPSGRIFSPAENCAGLDAAGSFTGAVAGFSPAIAIVISPGGPSIGGASILFGLAVPGVAGGGTNARAGSLAEGIAAPGGKLAAPAATSTAGPIF